MRLILLTVKYKATAAAGIISTNTGSRHVSFAWLSPKVTKVVNHHLESSLITTNISCLFNPHED